MKTPNIEIPQTAGVTEKRIYRKPGVQVYGTLKTMTRGATQPNTHRQDNPAPFPPPGNQPNNRT